MNRIKIYSFLCSSFCCRQSPPDEEKISSPRESRGTSRTLIALPKNHRPEWATLGPGLWSWSGGTVRAITEPDSTETGKGRCPVVQN
jgi:hypothetical protein